MDFTHWWPPESLPPPPQAIHHPYNPYPPRPLPPPLPSYYPNPNPNPYAPHAGYAVGPAAGTGANVGASGGLTAYYYARIGGDPVSYEQIMPRSCSGSDVAAAPSYAAPRQKGTKSNNKKGSKPTKVLQSAYCGVCKIECTTQEVLSTHKQGKKHKKKLQKLQESITPKPQKPQVTTNPKEKKEQKKRKDAPEEDLETKKRKILEGGVQPDEVKVCTICNVVANSQKVFDSHIAGSKHAENVKKLQESLQPVEAKKKEKGKRNLD